MRGIKDISLCSKLNISMTRAGNRFEGLYSPFVGIRGPRALAASHTFPKIGLHFIAERASKGGHARAHRLWRRDSPVVRRLAEYRAFFFGRGQIKQVIRRQTMQARIGLIRGERRICSKRRIRGRARFVCSTFTRISLACTPARMRSTDLAVLTLVFPSQSIQDRIHDHEASRSTNTRRTCVKRVQKMVRHTFRKGYNTKSAHSEREQASFSIDRLPLRAPRVPPYQLL